MQRQSVSSSNLASIGYDAEIEILEVEFNHGGVYQYFDVPSDIYNKLMEASSHGVYFSANIKNNYRTLKIK